MYVPIENSDGKTSTNSYETFMYGKLVRRK